MIAHLRGRVAARGSGDVVIDVNGVGYRVHVATTAQLPPRGETVELYTSMQVREDSMTLYGFPERSALELFELLLTSSGVGPRLALAALATHAPQALRQAIAGSDLDALVLVPGIGKKVAQRLVLELKDKVGVAAVAEAGSGAGPAPEGPVAEVRAALAQLGYGAGEIQSALAAIDLDGDAADLLRAALRAMSSTAVAAGSR